MNGQDRWMRYIELRSLVLDKRANDAELNEFEQLVFLDEVAKRDFVEHLHQESALLTHEGLFRDVTANVNSSVTRMDVRGLPDVPAHYPWGYVAIAASVVLLSIAGVIFIAKQRNVSLATMGVTRDCQWGASDMSTMPGAALTRGRLMLVSGIATLKFPWVDLTLEGPANVELIGDNCCRVHSGRVYTEVRPGGEGFVVETPTATLIDRGTIFGVNVLSDGTSDVNVIQGLIDARHLATGETVFATTNCALRMSESTIEYLSEQLESNSSISNVEDLEASHTVQITTAVGNGRDAYVIARMERPTTKDIGALLVKESNVENGAWRRRAYLHFDLSLLPSRDVSAAKLRLQGVATDLGYLAATPNTTFAVYGLTDEIAEAWDDDHIDWRTCPGTTSNRIQLDSDKTTLLGTFVVSNSEPTGVFSIEGEKLMDFIRSDTNGGATIIISSETPGEGQSYVHGFASKRHISPAPPTLRIVFSEDN